MTWVLQIRLAFGHSAHRLSVGPPALGQTESNLKCAASLATGGYNQPCRPIESFLIETHRLSLMIRPNYKVPSCLTATVSYSTIYPNLRSPSSLAWIKRTQAGLRPNPLAVEPPALVQTKSYSVQPCLPLAATIGPAGPLRVFFY